MASLSSGDTDHKWSDKRLKKKMIKIEKSLSTKENIVISKDQTKILCVQNGGLGNGVSQEELFPLFSKFGDLDGIVMLPQKQFCFVCYTDIMSAVSAYEKINGFMLKKGSDPTQDVYLYLCFVEKAPPSISPSSKRPPGLDIIEEFVSEETERALIDLMDVDMDLEGASEETSVMRHRKVKHFGFEFKYGINDVDVTDPLTNGIPVICHGFLKEAKEKGLIHHFPDQLTINSYQPGQGIPAHVDTREAFEDGIVSLSLGSQVVMDFRHPDGQHISVLLPRRSLMVMRGESRYVWSHGITPRKSDIVPGQAFKSHKDSGDGADCGANIGGLTLQYRERRVSYTFRKVIENRQHTKDVNCRAGSWKDPVLEGDIIVPETDEEAVALERKHVNKVYEDIAEHFSGTRYKPWPRVVDFLMEQPPFSLLADVGCGNGKCLGANKDLFEIGSDFSSNLAAICHSRGFQTCVGDVTCLPFRSGSFDVILCIAVIHHMATKQRRHKALSEVVRIIRKGGKALVYVWAMEQELNKAQSKYINTRRQQKQEDQRNRDTGSDAEGISVEKLVGANSNVAETKSEAIVDHHLELGKTSGSEVSERKSVCDDCDSGLSIEQVKNRARQICVRHVNNETLKNESDQQKEEFIDTNSNVGFPGGEEGEDSLSSQQKKLTIHVNRTQFKDQDLLVPWQLKTKPANSNEADVVEGAREGSLFHRFYHVFRQGELEAMCKRLTGCRVIKSYYDQGNWCVIIEKL